MMGARRDQRQPQQHPPQLAVPTVGWLARDLERMDGVESRWLRVGLNNVVLKSQQVLVLLCEMKWTLPTRSERREDSGLFFTKEGGWNTGHWPSWRGKAQRTQLWPTKCNWVKYLQIVVFPITSMIKFGHLNTNMNMQHVFDYVKTRFAVPEYL